MAEIGGHHPSAAAAAAIAPIPAPLPPESAV